MLKNYSILYSKREKELLEKYGTLNSSVLCYLMAIENVMELQKQQEACKNINLTNYLYNK